MKKHTQRLLLMGAMIMVPAAAMGQNADPFAAPKADSNNAKVVDPGPVTIRTVYEVFSLPMKQAAAIQRPGIDDSAFYQKMLDGLKKMTVKQETFIVIRGVSGQTTVAFEGNEYIYNTEAEPPELPNLVASTKKENPEGKKGSVIDAFPVTPATPSAFDTKNLGKTVELEVMMGPGGKYIDIRTVTSEIKFIQRDSYGQGVSKVEMPRFSAQRLKTGVTVFTGKPSYLGTVSPASEVQSKEDAPRVWFAFITASTVKL